MKVRPATIACSGLMVCATVLHGAAPEADEVAAVRRSADPWRAEHRIIDLHQHIEYTPERLARAVRIMDRVGIGIEVNLSGGTTTHEEGKPSEFERNKELADKLFPGRFMHYMNLDYSGLVQPVFSESVVKQI